MKNMSKKTLLLNATYEVLSFIPAKKVLKLIFKDKAEILSTWEECIAWGSGKINFPSVLRLKNYVKINQTNVNFSRKVLIKRDKSTCQYCNKKLVGSQITVDHVIPKSHGGATSFNNCVICCLTCNSKKANNTPEQANMKLLKKPTHPSYNSAYFIYDYTDHWHNDWDNFIV
jgi:hypothetical protein